MAWLSFNNSGSTFLLGNNSGNKGYRTGSANKQSLADKSATPLLPDSGCTTSKEELECDWPEITKKSPQSSSKCSFLSSGFFEKGSLNTKLKSAPNQDTFPSASKVGKEGRKLLSEPSKKVKSLSLSDEEDSDDDEWSFRQSNGYKKVKQLTD